MSEETFTSKEQTFMSKQVTPKAVEPEVPKTMNWTWSVKCRRLIVGFESSKTGNGKFLKKLNKMIDVKPKLNHKMAKIMDMNLRPGEN